MVSTFSSISMLLICGCYWRLNLVLGFHSQSGPNAETECTFVSHSGCIDLRLSVSDPLKHRMNRVGIVRFQLVFVLLGSNRLNKRLCC